MTTYTLRIDQDANDFDQDIKITFDAPDNETARDEAEQRARAALPEDHTAWCNLFIGDDLVDEFEIN